MMTLELAIRWIYRGGDMFSRPRVRVVLGAAIIVASAIFVFGTAWAGTTGQLSGVIHDAKTGEPISLASIAIPELKRGAVTDAQGNYTILNVPAGRYSVRVSLLGYVSQLRENVEIIQDFTTKLDFSVESTVLTNVPEVVVKGERPLIQKDNTGSAKFLSGDDIKNQPLRGYQDAVAQQSGVVNFKLNIDNEAQNNNTLIIRGGRPNEVAYYVDGFNQQDPLTGVSTTAINNDAIQEIVVQTGGFNAEYGRVNSGAINLVTKEGSEKYFGSAEGIYGDWMKKSRGYKNFSAALGGPLTPGTKQVTFYAAGERRDTQDRRPSIITDQVGDPSQPGLFTNGVLPANESKTWSGIGKVSWRPSPLKTLKLGGTFNEDKWRQYQNTYRFDLDHSPRFRDKNYSAYGTWNQSLNTRSYYEVKANYFLTDRIRGDGLYFDDLKKYAFPQGTGNPTYDPTEAIFWFGPQDPQGAHVFDDFLHRKSSYVGFAADYANQINKSMQLKFGGDYQRHTLRYYDHYFPTQLYEDSAGVLLPKNTRDVDRYGYDAFGEEINGGLDGPKHPKVASLYGQGKYERLGLVVNAGLRFDYLTPNTQSLRSETNPLQSDTNDSLNSPTTLDPADLQDSKVYRRLSPRLGVGFPVSDRTLVHVNYGKFFQQPNLQDLYVSYAFLEHKVRTGGYFVGFGNPNLKPERTTAYELGIAHTPTDRSRIEATAYYKDVKDLVEITNVPSNPNAFSTYQNRDFATIKGLDLAYTLRRVGHASMTASYSISWAMGTGSVSQTQRNIAWTADETPKMASPLAFDQRHKFSWNFDYRLNKGEGPSLGGTKLLENAGINFLLNAGSGFPYTPTRIYNEVTLASVAAQPIGPINSRYGPWTIDASLKANKGISVGGQNLDVYVWVLNIFNRDNIRTVYTGSGNAETTNFLNTEEGQSTYDTADAQRRYALAERSPTLHDTGRLVRLGAKLSF
jgi:outer membrane receptor protein involved in Fe transport